MGVNSNQYLQGINQTTGTGAPVHSAVAGDRYTDTATGTTYQYTTSWQTVSYSAGALVYFTEAQSTTSPNATVNVDSLTAIASTTNADFVIKPKGTGALLAAIPDSAGTGGNKRGVSAVDLQMTRYDATNVASGAYSVLCGGQYNTASGNSAGVLAGYNNRAIGYQSSVLGGDGNQTPGSYSTAGGRYSVANCEGDFVFGYGNTTNGLYYNTIFGYANTISGGAYSVALGSYNSLTGYRHFAGGNNHTLTFGFGSTAFGQNGKDNGFGRFIYSRNGFVKGDNQASKVILSARTTDATPKVLSVDFIAADASTQITLQPNNSIRFKGTIIGRQSGSTNTSAWDIDGIIQMGVGVGTTTLLMSNVNVVQNTPAWGTPTLAANTSLGCLTVNVTGAAANIQWTCAIDTTEVIYA